MDKREPYQAVAIGMQLTGRSVRIFRSQKGCFVKGLLIGAVAVMIGAMAEQLAAQGVVTLDTGNGAKSYSLGAVVVVPLGDATPVMVSNPRRWGLTSSLVGSHGGSRTPDWAYRPPCADRSDLCRHGDTHFSESGYASDPAFYPETHDDVYAVLPSAIVEAPMVQHVDTPAPTTPAPRRSEMSEYIWPSSSNDSRATTFSIVSKDGRIQSATAVWVQDNALCYYSPDGRTGRMPIDSIDVETTRQRSAGRWPSFGGSSATAHSIASSNGHVLFATP